MHLKTLDTVKKLHTLIRSADRGLIDLPGMLIQLSAELIEP